MIAEKFFRWRSGEKYGRYCGKTDAEEEKLDLCFPFFDVGAPLPPLEQWETPLLAQYLGEGSKKRKPRKVGDCVSTVGINLISPRAVDALSDIFERHDVRLYPVQLDDTPEVYYAVAVKTVIDCLDEDASKVERNIYGNICSIYTWVFKEGFSIEADLFVLPYDNRCCLVSERFKERVVQAKLKGFAFHTHFFDLKPFVS